MITFEGLKVEVEFNDLINAVKFDVERLEDGLLMITRRTTNLGYENNLLARREATKRCQRMSKYLDW